MIGGIAELTSGVVDLTTDKNLNSRKLIARCTVEFLLLIDKKSLIGGVTGFDIYQYFKLLLSDQSGLNRFFLRCGISEFITGGTPLAESVTLQTQLIS